jgi:hypothetical protein
MRMRVLASLVCAIVLLPVLVLAQEEMGKFVQQEENWKKLQSFRVWTIIDTLGLDASSEKGIAFLDVINRTAEKERELFVARMRNDFALHKALDQQQIDEAEITRLIDELDRINTEQFQIKLKEQEEIKRLLTPLERARLLIADERFREHLRQAMHGSWRGGPPKPHDDDRP